MIGVAGARGRPGGAETGLGEDKQVGPCRPMGFPCEVNGAAAMASFYR